MDPQPHVQLPYPCDTILFRAVISPYWIKKGEHKATVFFRREGNDPSGVSLFDSIEACKTSMPSGIIYGVRSVHVGRLFDSPSGLWLFPDGDDPSHCNIRLRDGTVTPRLSEDAATCRNLAEDLMAVSRPVEYWQQGNADERFQAELQAKRDAR